MKISSTFWTYKCLACHNRQHIFSFAHILDTKTKNALKLSSTLCLKKVLTFKLSVTLSNLNRFSNFLYCWKACEICYKSHTTSPTSPQACYYTTLGYQKFKFSANIQQLWKNVYKSHFHFFQCTDFNFSMCVTVYAECIYVFLSKSCPCR